MSGNETVIGLPVVLSRVACEIDTDIDQSTGQMAIDDREAIVAFEYTVEENGFAGKFLKQ